MTARIKHLMDNEAKGNFVDMETMMDLSSSIETKEFKVYSKESEVEKMWWILIS